MSELEAGMMATPNIVLEKKLAEGGMGSVWVADHLTLKTRVAVKFVRSEFGKDKDAMARFEREATAVARIKSPHIVQVLDYGRSEAAGQPFIVMELLDGEDLATRIDRDGPLPLAYVANVLTQAAKAIGKAHQAGIVHRDIKPDNVFLVDPEGDVFVKLLDFGIAKWTEPTLSSMTSTGSMMGTPHYMAPEQMTSAKDVAPASDIWALGVVAYNALTAQVPFDGETMAALAIAVHTGKYTKASEIVTSLPSAIDAWFDRALAKDPKARFASTRELADTLRAIAEGKDWAAIAEMPVSAQTMSVRSPSTDETKPARAANAGRSDTINRANTASPVRSTTRSRAPIAFGLVAAGALAVGGFFVYTNSANKADTKSTSDPARASSTAIATRTEGVPSPKVTAQAPIVEPASASVRATASASATASALATDASAAPSASAKAGLPGRPNGGVEHPPAPSATAKATSAPAVPTAAPTGISVTF